MRRAGSADAFIKARIKIEDRGYSSPCWVWQLGLTDRGYAKAKVPQFGKNTRVHRASYELWVEPIRDGLTIDHLCRVRCCVNPAHLEAVTQQENFRRAIPFLPRPVSKPHTRCRCGVEFTPENKSKGRAWCKPCWATYIRERVRAQRPHELAA